jgi:hypothetical protein
MLSKNYLPTDNVSWVYGKIRPGTKAFFYRNDLKGKVYLIAANRAARRLLMSESIQKEAARLGATIEVDVPVEGEAPVIAIH